MNATRVDLLRHGETTGGALFRGSVDDALTPRGLNEMRAAVASAGPWDAVVSSPLARCTLFARDWAQRCGLPLLIEQDLRELHFGAWEGECAAVLMRTDADRLSRFWADPYAHPPPEGESVDAFEQRVLRAWNTIIERHADARILIVTHGGVIRVILRVLEKRPRSTLLERDVPLASLHTIAVKATVPIRRFSEVTRR